MQLVSAEDENLEERNENVSNFIINYGNGGIKYQYLCPGRTR